MNSQQWKNNHPEMAKVYNRRSLTKKYGLTIKQYDEIFEQQGGVCAICGKPEKNKNQYGIKRLAVDHDHNTGKVRGLLCQGCNVKLGWFDNLEQHILEYKYAQEKNKERD